MGCVTIEELAATSDWSTNHLDQWLNMTYTIDRKGPIVTGPYRQRIRDAQQSRYRIHCKNRPRRAYAVTWLAYPAPMTPSSDPNAWSYLMSACTACFQLKRDPWFAQNVDCVILTPEIVDPQLRVLVQNIFDRHVEYFECLRSDPPPGDEQGIVSRWNGVFNKIHVFNPDVYPYDRVLLMDSEVLVKDFERYRRLFALSGDFVGASESTELSYKDAHYQKLPAEYGSYSSGRYVTINAGILLIRPDHNDFYNMKSLLLGGWTYTCERRPEYRGRMHDQLDVWCPEQEFLTCFFAGRSYHMGPLHDFFSIRDSPAHWTFDDPYGTKIWSRPLGYPALSDLYIGLIEEWLETHLRFSDLTYITCFLEKLRMRTESDVCSNGSSGGYFRMPTLPIIPTSSLPPDRRCILPTTSLPPPHCSPPTGASPPGIPPYVNKKARDRKGVECGGDPYIYPLIGPPVKLPNCDQIYRLYQDAEVVVNARVQRADTSIQLEIEDMVRESGVRVVSSEAYFFSQLFIGSRDNTDDHVVVDLIHKSTSGPTDQFRVDAPIVDTTKYKYDEDSQSSCVSIPIRWGDDMCLTVSFSRNPQVRNGLRLCGSNIQHGTGLLIRNYRARFFQLSRMDDCNEVLIPKNCRRTTTNRGVKGHKEMRLGVGKWRLTV